MTGLNGRERREGGIGGRYLWLTAFPLLVILEGFGRKERRGIGEFRDERLMQGKIFYIIKYRRTN